MTDHHPSDSAPPAIDTPFGSVVAVPGGMAYLGTDRPVIAVDGEGPVRRKRLKPFWIGATSVTNAAFARFVDDTGYVTDAERIGWSFVFWSHVVDHIEESRGAVGHEWWRGIEGATWRAVAGPGSEATHWHPDHPVVHVSWNDARAFADWAGGRLPKEAEWEHAARGGLGDARFPWGDEEPDDDAFTPCNVWQGDFPASNSLLDGFETTAPARSFAPNGYGIYNVVGNVWEWTADPYTLPSNRREARMRQAQMKGNKVLKGGSFLCHRSYCYRYRIAARIGNTPDTSLSHTGFRVAWDRPPAADG